MSDQVAIDERIQQLVEAHRQELEQSRRPALERELALLVEQRLAARNGLPDNQVGNAPAATPSEQPEPSARTDATKVCDGCGETKPEAAFEKYRRRCRDCRRRDRRNAPPAEPAEGRPTAVGITAAELAERARRQGSADAAELERWLVDGRLAELTPAGPVPTPLALELADSLDLALATG